MEPAITAQKIPEKQDRFIYPIADNHLPYTFVDFDLGIDFQYDMILKREILHIQDQYTDKDNRIFTANTMQQCFSYFNHQRKNRSLIKSSQFFKTIRLPQISNDFYHNILDWSPNNVIGLGIKKNLYAWVSYSERAHKIYKCANDSKISSVKFSHNQQLAIGETDGALVIRDLRKNCNVIRLKSRLGKVQALDWSNSVLAVGSAEGYVIFWDIRLKNVIDNYKPHQQYISTLKWNFGKNIMASGGSDNKIQLFDTRKFSYLVCFQESYDPVKGIDWCPDNPSILATGGGKDEHVRFFSSSTLRYLYSIDTKSPICNLSFSRISNELMTTHDKNLHEFKIWNSKNVWQSEEYVEQTGIMTGHRSRALHIATNPDGNTVATVSRDRTLKLWHPFQNDRSRYTNSLTTADLR